MDSTKKIRISRYLASCGIASRRKCEEFVLRRRIKVNNEVVCDLSFPVSTQDRVEMDGRLLKYQEKMTLMCNKPVGYLSTVRDDFNRKTILDLIDDKSIRLYPVGRLDYDSRGLIILTNDGDIAYRIMHPKFKVPKTYIVGVDSKMESNDIEKIKKGIEIESRKLVPLSVKVLESGKNITIIEIKIIEGRKRILRKIFAKIGYNIADLKRTMIGGLGLNGLQEGLCRRLKTEDMDNLFSAVDNIL